MSAEKRTSVRYEVELAAEVVVDGRVLVAATQNISKGGVGVVLDQPLASGSEVGLMLFLTEDGIEDPDEEPLEVTAHVRWSQPHPGGKHVSGVQFTALSADQRGQLERFLTAFPSG
jgi:c-di-GMP-binding flagellar brake protein YcgR